MAFGVSISGKKPVATVTVGSVTIPIYACPVTVTKPVVATVATDAKNGVVTETRTYQSFQLSHFEGARRVLQRRNTLERAKALAKEVATRLNRDGSPASARRKSRACGGSWWPRRRNAFGLSPPPRHPVAGHGGILAPLPGLDRRPPKPKCVYHFTKNLVSQLTWTHNP